MKRVRLSIVVLGGGAIAGAGALASGCYPNTAGYCAPGTIECTIPDGGTVQDGTTVDTSAGDEEIVISRPDGQAADGGSADGADAADGFICDLAKTPSEEACVVTDALGVFTSPSGVDANPGTKAAPVQTLAHGLALAKAQGKRLYACSNGGAYAESVVVGPSLDGITAYGGLDCTSWAYLPTAKAQVAPSAAGYALRVSGLATGVTFEDFAFTAQPGVRPGDSSIAVFVSTSTAVNFTRCALTAGAAQPGADQTAAAVFSSAAPTGQPGTADAGGAATPNACAGSSGVSFGGAGGPPSTNGADGQPGSPGVANGGTTSSGDCTSGVGRSGASGDGGAAGEGAPAWDLLDAGVWSPMSGQAGGGGGVGQGGGGGASLDTSGGGGAGGAGGCGGGGGLAGTGGGSSLALLALNASVDLAQCALIAGDAGRGGNGAAGQVGQSRGLSGTQFGSECPGGRGGYGGSGGGGGGGAGGLSAGVAWSGTAPSLDGTPITSAMTLSNVTLGTAGAAGSPGAGGAAVGTGANAGASAPNDAKAGVAAAVVQVQ